MLLQLTQYIDTIRHSSVKVYYIYSCTFFIPVSITETECLLLQTETDPKGIKQVYVTSLFPYASKQVQKTQEG